MANFTWTDVSPGTYALVAVEHSGSFGGGSTTIPILITVAAPTGSPTEGTTVTSSPTPPIPTVSITSPANNATVSVPIVITANASVVGSAISKVDFYARTTATGTVFLGSALSSPYSFTWTNAVGATAYTLTAIATANGGGTATSDPVTIFVSDATPTPTITPTSTATPTLTLGAKCAVSYTITSQWPGGFGVNVIITNIGTTTINGWSLVWTFANGQTITQIWNASSTASGGTITVTNLSYDGTIAPNANVNFGFNGSWSGTNAKPIAFTLNRQSCSS